MSEWQPMVARAPDLRRFSESTCDACGNAAALALVIEADERIARTVLCREHAERMLADARKVLEGTGG